MRLRAVLWVPMNQLLSNGTRVAGLREGLLRQFMYSHLRRLLLRMKWADAKTNRQTRPSLQVPQCTAPHATVIVRLWPNCPASHNDIPKTTIAASCNGNLKFVSQMNQDSSVCIVTKVRTECQTKVVKISSAMHPDGLCGPHPLLWVMKAFFQRVNRPQLEADHLMLTIPSRLRMSGTLHPFSMPTWSTQTQLYFDFASVPKHNYSGVCRAWIYICI